MTEILKKEGNKVYFNLSVPYDTVEKAQQAVYLKEKGKFSVPGFRKGKVPRKIIEMTYGHDIFFEDAINDILPDLYENAVEELKLELAGRPDISIPEPFEKDKDVKIEVAVDVMPEIELKDYSTIEIPKIEYEVTDELINNELESERKKAGRVSEVTDRAAEMGDTLKIDFHGMIDDEPFEGGHAHDQELELGSNAFIPGFEEQLVGAKVGDHVDVKVTFPEEYHAEELAGKDAVFHVDVLEIATVELPELDDEFVKDISEFDTLDEYKADLKEKMAASFEERAKRETRDKVVEKIVEYAEFEVPEGLIESQIDSEINNFGANLQMQGIDFQQYLEWTQGNMQEMRDTFRPISEKNAKIQLVLEAIGKKENIEVSEDEINEEIENLAKTYYPEDEEEAKKFIENVKSRDTDYFKKNLTDKKTIDLLMEKVVYKEEE